MLGIMLGRPGCRGRGGSRGGSSGKGRYRSGQGFLELEKKGETEEQDGLLYRNWFYA
jgi:hypothetical protein